MMENLEAILKDEVWLREALGEAELAPLLMVLVHLTGDVSVLNEYRRYIEGPWDYMVKVPTELREKLNERVIQALRELALGQRSLEHDIPKDMLRNMMATAASAPVPDDYIPLIMQETGLTESDPERVDWRGPPPRERLKNFRVVVIGAGLSGLCMGIKLREAGIPFDIFEKNDSVGGTWYENKYPGCGVDTPNHFYSYSFEPNHEWSHYFAKRDELWQYLEHCTDKYDVRRSISFNTEVLSARFDERRLDWELRVRSKDGVERTTRADAVVCAVGQLNRPSVPDIPGRSEFLGPSFHSAQWDESVKVNDKRVALVGTGASGMQVGPSIADSVDRLIIFQRSPHWAMPHPYYHRKVSEHKKWLLRNLPLYAKWYRFQLFWAAADGLYASLQVDPDWDQPDVSLNAKNHEYRAFLIDHIRNEIGNAPDLLEKAVPDYPPYGKRMLRDNHWYKMLIKPNVDLVTDRIDRFERDAIVTHSGERYPVDMIVFATGFQADRLLWPMEITGRGGVTIRDQWGDDDPRAYLGITIPRFPNFFVMYGPNTNLAHGGSAIFHTECQVRYTMQCLRELIEKDWAAMECSQEAHDTYNRRVDDMHRKMVWAHPRVTSWYKNKRGRVFATSPWRLVDYWHMTRRLDTDDYIFYALSDEAANDDAVQYSVGAGQ